MATSSKPKVKKLGAGLPPVDSSWKKLIASQPELFPNLGKKKKIPAYHEHKPTLPKIWFDDVDPIDLDPADRQDYQSGVVDVVKPDSSKSTHCPALEKNKGTEGLTKAVAMDCEMVGIGEDEEETGSIVARVTIVNHFRKVIYDKYVKPTDTVLNYRTAVSGIRPSDLEKGEEFKIVQREVAKILKNRILVGHAVHHDLQVLFLGHPRRDIRDTSRYIPFKKMFSNKTPSLKRLSEKLLGVKIQDGEHDSIQDAQATMRLYTMHRIEWENSLRRFNNKSKDDAKKKLDKSSNAEFLWNGVEPEKEKRAKITQCVYGETVMFDAI